MLTSCDTRLDGFQYAPSGWQPIVFEHDRRLQRLEAFVQENYSDPISLARAARQACLARCYFSTYFRRQAGIGFHRWLTCLRIHRATRELLASDQTVTDIAWNVGFQDMTTFTRAFRRITGTTPTVYRRRHGTAAIAANGSAASVAESASADLNYSHTPVAAGSREGRG